MADVNEPGQKKAKPPRMPLSAQLRVAGEIAHLSSRGLALTMLEEWVPEATRLEEAEREWCKAILDADQRDMGDGRILATLANMATVRLRELGGS